MPKQHFEDNYYFITDDLGNEIFRVSLDESVGGDQVVISTPNEVYAGPISLISFSSELK